MSRAPHLGRSGEWLCRPQESRQRPGPQPAPNQYHLLYRAYLLVAVRDELVSDEVQNPSATSITQYCTAPIVHPIQRRHTSILTVNEVIRINLLHMSATIRLLLGLLQHSKRFLYHLLRLRLSHYTQLLKVASIEFPHRRMLAYDLIHPRLCKGWLISFVMSPATIADQIDQDVLMKMIAIGMRHAYRRHTGIRIVGVHMNNGNLKSLRQIASKVRRATILRLRSKTKLVVHDNMYCTPDPIAIKMPQVQCLRYHSFTWKGSITMNQDR